MARRLLMSGVANFSGAVPMSSSVFSALSVHTQALSLKGERMQLLAANLANADTPNYKARDIDFKAALAEARTVRPALTATHAAHIPLTDSSGGAPVHVQYRIPSQPSLDGNTVDAHAEQAAFAETAVQYQASLTLAGMRIAGLRSAIRGE